MSVKRLLPSSESTMGNVNTLLSCIVWMSSFPVHTPSSRASDGSAKKTAVGSSSQAVKHNVATSKIGKFLIKPYLGLRSLKGCAPEQRPGAAYWRQEPCPCVRVPERFAP